MLFESSTHDALVTFPALLSSDHKTMSSAERRSPSPSPSPPTSPEPVRGNVGKEGVTGKQRSESLEQWRASREERSAIANAVAEK